MSENPASEAQKGNRNAAKGDKNDSADLRNGLTQRDRAEQNGISQAAQKRLDKIAKLAPDYLSRIAAKEISINRAAVELGIVKDEHAALVAKKVELEGIVRKGTTRSAKSRGQEKVAENAGFTGRGVVSPAIQLGEQIGRKKDYMQARFKEWAALTGYEGPMSSVEGEDIKALAAFCAEYEAEKARKAEKAKDDKADKAAKEKAKVSNLEKAVFKDLERFEVGENGANQHSAGFDKKEGVKPKPTEKGGNSSAYRAAKLKRDHPDIYQKLI